VHFSVFGPAFATRIVTQMYFPGDPLLDLDPLYNAVPDEAARKRLICAYDPNLSEAEWALGYRFDIVLRGRGATPVGM
jgi:protocatechuate 3,4-dioxygenase beta subunit